MLDYIFSLLNEVLPYLTFKNILFEKFSIILSDGDYFICYLLFILCCIILALITILFLIYFIKHSINVWFGRRRYR